MLIAAMKTMTRLIVILFTTILLLLGHASAGQTKNDSLKYKVEIAQADSCFNIKDYTSAKTFYIKSLQYEKNAKYPKDKLVICDKLINDKQIDKMFKELIVNADTCFLSRNYSNAVNYYNSASNLRREDKYSKNMLLECMVKISEADNRTKKIAHLLYRADSCLIKQDTLGAKEFYMKAISVDDKCFLRAKLALLDWQILCCSEGQNGLSKEYNCAIKKAEQFMNWKKYNEAILAYKEALTIQDKSYPKEMIKRCEKLIKEQK